MTANGPTATLANWVVSTRYEDMSSDLRKEATTLLYDQTGCMIVSANLPSCQPVVDLMRRLGTPGACSVVGHSLRTSVLHAALCNGSIGHGDEVDSTGQHGTGHFAAAIIPTVLTAGQFANASGKELLRAIALGAEVAGRFVSLLNHYGTRPQFGSSVGHTMGAAVAAGVLFKLNADQMEHALGLAASGACGLNSHHEEELHQIKSLEFGRATEQGILSALLAQQGYHGPREVMTTEHGFFDAFLGLPSAGEEVVENLGEKFLIHEVAYKRYPVGGPDQTPLYAFLQLIRKNNLKADDIEQIEVSVTRGAFHTVMTNRHPSVHMHTILCLASVYGDITFPHIHDPRYREDPRFKAFQERVRIFIIPRPGPATSSQRMEMSLKVRTGDGRVLSQDLRFPLMTPDEIRNKFRTLVGLRLPTARVEELERKLTNVEQEGNVATLVQGLEVA
jgi:2-methylcitrate dehydratase PrpD